jgi:hypothetical protein
MKTGIWVVVLWYRGQVVAGDSLDRLTTASDELLAEGRIPSAPMRVISAHTSARAADRAAAQLAEKLKPFGWWLAEGSAQSEEGNQEGSEDEC